MGGQESLETLWFVYTLFITKLALQYFRRNLDLIMINVICILICILLLKFGISGRNAILNAAPAFPFVSFGFFLRKYRGMLNRKYKLPVLLLVCIVMIVVTSLVYFLNGAPWMFRNDYGNDFSAFFIGGVSGTALIYCIAKFFENKTSNTLVLLSNGTLVILAIHPQFLRLIGTCGFELGLSKYVLAIVILVLFVPILSFCKRYLPILAR